MNCFVIMPFAAEFDDVYAVIKSTVESAGQAQANRCFRLDESRPAGRITDRLVSELRSATICVADLTGTKPNVMWEVGFAMALGKPTVLITQSNGELPFDIKDMQTIQYDRAQLNSSLSRPLRQSLLDTLAYTRASNLAEAPGTDQPELIGSLLNEVAALKVMVAEAVQAWKQRPSPERSDSTDLAGLEGHWTNTESGSNIYLRLVGGELIGPYCYGGDDDLTGVYYGWQRIGSYWFARYAWANAELSGFSFLRMESVDVLAGAWWSSEHKLNTAEGPPNSAGVPSTWVRQPTSDAPAWATSFLAGAKKVGVDEALTKIGWPVEARSRG
jgi:hypothetical protein